MVLGHPPPQTASLGWELAATLNVVIATCYVLISASIVQGLLRTRQLATNPLAVATAAIFTTCAVHQGHHAAHLMLASGDAGHAEQLSAVRAVFGEWHTVLVDGVGAAVAVTYLGLRRNYKALLNTPAMFDDAVRVAAEKQLRELAFTDLLTGIPNRAAYQQYADSLPVDSGPVVVLFIDLDGFKSSTTATARRGGPAAAAGGAADGRGVARERGAVPARR